MYLCAIEMTTKLVFNVLILDLNKNKKQNWEPCRRGIIRSYFNFVPKISITMQVLHVLL